MSNKNIRKLVLCATAAFAMGAAAPAFAQQSTTPADPNNPTGWQPPVPPTFEPETPTQPGGPTIDVTTGVDVNNNANADARARANATGGNGYGYGGEGGQGGQGGAGGSVGNIDINTINNARTYFATHAPGLSGALDDCTAILSRSGALNVLGVGIGAGGQRMEYSEQCAAVQTALIMLQTAGDNVDQQIVAYSVLAESLTVFKVAVENAAALSDGYRARCGTEMRSALSAWRQTCELPAAPAVTVAPAAPAQPPVQLDVTVNVNETAGRAPAAAERRPAQPPARRSTGGSRTAAPAASAAATPPAAPAAPATTTCETVQVQICRPAGAQGPVIMTVPARPGQSLAPGRSN